MRMTPPENDVNPPDDICAACHAPLDKEEMKDEGSLAFEGFCCRQCKKGEGVITTLTELCHYVGGESLAGIEDIRALSDHISDHTSCGAYCGSTSEPPGVVLGSIVEGVDQGTTEYKLPFPFRIERFWNTVNDVEAEADEIWHQTHGCEDCGDEDPETGYTPIRDDCETCGGDGTVI